MRKGTTGLNLSFYAVIGFILAILGQTLLGGLLIGFAIIVEKDKWLVQQTITAFVLSIASSVISTILNAINVFSAIPFVGSAVNKMIDSITGLIFFVILIACLIAISRVKNDKDADIPLASKFAKWVYNSSSVE